MNTPSKIVLLFLCAISIQKISAQDNIEKKARLEFAKPVTDLNIKVMADSTVLTYYYNNNGIFTFTLYDRELKELSTENVKVDQEESLINVLNQEKKIYLLFATIKENNNLDKGTFKKFALVEFDKRTKKQRTVASSFEKQFSLENMFCNKGKIYLIGNGSMNIATIDFSSGECKIEQLDQEKKGTSIILACDTTSRNSGFVQILSKTKGKKASIFLYKFNLNSAEGISTPVEIALDKNQECYSAQIKSISGKEILITGCYGKNAGNIINKREIWERQEGVNITKVKNDNIVFSNNFSLATIFNFDPSDTKSAKKDQRIIVRDIIEKENEYIIIGESYMLKYKITGDYKYDPFTQSENQATFDNTSTKAEFQGYYFEKCISFAISKTGQFLWSSEFNTNINMASLNQSNIGINITKTGIGVQFIKDSFFTYELQDKGYNLINIKSFEINEDPLKSRKGDELFLIDLLYWYNNKYIYIIKYYETEIDKKDYTIRKKYSKANIYKINLED